MLNMKNIKICPTCFSGFFFLLLCCICFLEAGGQQQFEATYGGSSSDAGGDVIQSGSIYFIAGSTSSYGQGNDDMLFLRLEDCGDLLCATTMGSSDQELAYGLAQYPTSGNLILVGETNGSFTNGMYDTYTVGLVHSYAGSVCTTSVYGGNGLAVGYDYDDRGYDVTINQSNRILIAGQIDEPQSGRDHDMFLTRFNSNGSFNAAKAYGGNSADRAAAIIVDADGDYLMAGATWYDAYNYGSNNPPSIYLVKTDQNGNIISGWNLIIGDQDEKQALDIIQTSDESYYIVTGFTYESCSTLII